MDKRLAKRHKRQVARARDKVKISEPDVRTPEQIAADREASRANSNIGGGGSSASGYTGSGVRNSATSTGSAAKTAV